MTKKKLLKLSSFSLIFLLWGCHATPPPLPPVAPPPVYANIGAHVVTGSYHCQDGKAPDLASNGLGQLTVWVIGNTQVPFEAITYYRRANGGGISAVYDSRSNYKGGGAGVENKITVVAGGDDDYVYLAVPQTGAFNIELQYMEWNLGVPSGFGSLTNCTNKPSITTNCWKWSNVISLGSGTVPNFAGTGNPGHTMSIDQAWDPKGGDCTIF